MKVYCVFVHIDNCESYEDHWETYDLLDIYSTLEKAKQAVANYEPTMLTPWTDEDGTVNKPTVTEITEIGWTRRPNPLRRVCEYLGKYEQYEHTLYIEERELQ